MKTQLPPKLHLGCGQVYLKGYTNIDFPSSSHTVQDTSVADIQTDLLKLRYDAGTVEEVRLHHVFEHFRRPTAYALIGSWQSWLKEGGRIHIEVPDFDRTAKKVLSPLSSKQQRAVALRHIFGSNEEFWAVHYEGWSRSRLEDITTSMGLQVVSTKKIDWKGTCNIEIIVEKTQSTKTKEQCRSKVAKILRDYLIDESESEMRLLDVWLKEYDEQVKLSWAK